jgi:hypothetical protein
VNLPRGQAGRLWFTGLTVVSGEVGIYDSPAGDAVLFFRLSGLLILRAGGDFRHILVLFQ